MVEVRQDFVTLRVEFDAPPSALAASPSGHQIYVALPRELMVLDRFTGERLTGTPLPAAVDAIRTDPRGQYLVGRVPGADSVLVIDVFAHQVTGRVGSVWSHRLPVFSPDGSLLVAADDDLVAVDPATREERGRVADAGDAIWVTLSWDPRRPVPQLEVDVEEEEQEAEPDQSGARIFYAQLSSTQNQAWAEGFVVNLRQAGLDAQVLAPDETYDRFRVVLGPFTTRSEADETARKLGQAYFIFSEDTTRAR